MQEVRETTYFFFSLFFAILTLTQHEIETNLHVILIRGHRKWAPRLAANIN